MKAPEVAILCARRDSVYKTIGGCDVYDADRNAFSFDGKAPTVAHPPCRMWGRLRKMAKGSQVERALAPWCVLMVRECGGVLEHPAQSSLFKHMGLPRPGQAPDVYGGWTLAISQFWFGHRAEKPTWLYICGISPRDIPELPYQMGQPSRVITNKKGLRSGMPGFRKECTKSEREHTPATLAHWLVELARKTQNSGPITEAVA